jgi:uncharacterized protein (TIGR03382 family)
MTTRTPRTTWFQTLAAALALSLLPASVARAAMVAQWLPSGSVDETSFPATAVTNVTASPMTPAAGMVGVDSPGAYALRSFPGQYTVDTSRYIEFSITGPVTYSSVDFSWWSGNYASNTVQLRWSVDDFLAVLSTTSHPSDGSVRNVSLAVPAGSAHQVGTTTFRLYFYGSSYVWFPTPSAYIVGTGWSGTGLTVLGTPPCSTNQRVASHACVACTPPGTGRAAGDDPALGDTACTPIICTVNQHVVANACAACPAGSTRAAGDDATGAETECLHTFCGVDEHVATHACVACAAGSTRAAGDDATGPDTACPHTLCGVNEYVVSHACATCPPGEAHPAGDDATGSDTSCTEVFCGADDHVSAHLCVDCPPGMENPAGNPATGPDTSCTPIVCAADNRVVANACVPCAAGSTRPAGDVATGADTECTATVCGTDEHVAAHACVACASGSTRPAGDLATGGDTACDSSSGCGCTASPGGGLASCLAVLGLALLAPRRRAARARAR